MKARKNIRFNYRLQTFGGHKTNKLDMHQIRMKKDEAKYL